MNENTRKALSLVITEGRINGVRPRDCGADAELVQAVYDAFEKYGAEEARRVFLTVISGNPELAAAVAGDPEPPKRYELHWLSEAMGPQEPIGWRVDGIFAEGSLNLLVGAPGCKKTWLAVDCALCVALGKRWLGRETRQGPALIIDEESGRRRLERRIAGLARARHAGDATPLAYVSLSQFDFRDKDDVAAVVDLIKETGATFVVIDAMVDVMPGGDENAVKDVQPLLMALRKVAEETGAAIVLIHHAGKNGLYRGSSAISGAVDLMLAVESKPESPNIDLSAEKVRDVEPFQMAAHIRFHDDGAGLRVYVDPTDRRDEEPSFNDGEEYVMRYLRQNQAATVAEIMDKADTCAAGTAKNAVYSLAKRDLVRRIDDGGPGKAAVYDLTERIKLQQQPRPVIDDYLPDP